MIVPSGPPLHHEFQRPKFWAEPWLDPFLNGTFAAPWEMWDQPAGMMAMAIWVFVIIMVLFMIIYGGPRY